ncbi:MAG TPA: ATP-binding protein [Thermodesulfobacteriota bacterium]|nr:ATP-binding protein [Thermodesulfobacteriota bacterium]
MVVKREWFRRIYWVPIAVLIGGLLSIGMLLWTKQINEKQHIDFDVIGAVADMQTNIASCHTHIEEGISRDTSMDVEKISGEIDSAIGLAEAILNGGNSEHGMPLQPLKDSKLRKNVQDILLLLRQFKEIVTGRIQDAEVGRFSPDVYEGFHAVFREIQDKAKALEIVLETDYIRAQARENDFFWGILVVWTFIVAISTTGLWNRESRRKSAEKRLLKANEQLQAQARELETFREHLMDLVEDRTMELINSNRSLEHEITERKEAERSLKESENKCRLLVDYLPQQIYLKDRNSVYVYCNDNFARDLNIKAADIVGKTDYDLFPQVIAEKNRSEDKEILKSRKPLDIEQRHVKEGQERVIEKFKMPVSNEIGGINGILGILWDVTERVRLEAVAEAITLTNNIGYIFAGIGHEIGNPINSAKMTLSVLKEKIDACSKETIGEHLERALEEISRVEYLLRTLKSYNMYESIVLQNVEMKPFVDKFLSLLSDDFKKKGITVESMFDPDAERGYFDPRALQQVMLNIVSNAAHAVEGRENSRIVIQVLKADHAIRIHVTDNGCGISEEQQKRLFTPFFTTRSSGTGLGLAIAKKLLSRMGGAIEIKSQRGEGARVEISIQEGRTGTLQAE